MRICTLLLPGIAWLAMVHGVSAPKQVPQALIDSGRLQGLNVAALPRGGAFLGIPYAAQPVGSLRWRAPQPAPSWKEVRAADHFGPACPQAPSSWLPEMLGIERMPTGEACLYLNVWTPDLHPKKRLPVLVWVHGGGNVEGSGEWPPLGITLAQQGVVVVSINYRLGALGFLALPALAAESEQGVSGNYGHLDQLEALRWVRRNIEQFGGDPGQVTIGGQSSGALDVCNLMASPLSQGLFQRAILQSGVCVDSVYPEMRAMEANGEKLAQDLGITPGPKALQALRAAPAERILHAAASLDFEPEIDGWVLRRQPATTFAQGGQIRVPVLVGTNANEVSIFASSLVGGHSWRPKSAVEYQNWVRQKFGSYAQTVLTEYPAGSDGDARRAYEEMDTDYNFAFGAWLLATDAARVGQRAFLYDFTYVGPGPFAELGAFHSEELMFLSRRYWTSWAITPDDQALSDAIVGYWVQFIRNGTPDRAGLAEWPAYDQPLCQELGRRIGPQPVSHLQRFPVFQDYLNSRLHKAPN
jgi:para-nitrobenzyl esterase